MCCQSFPWFCCKCNLLWPSLFTLRPPIFTLKLIYIFEVEAPVFLFPFRMNEVCLICFGFWSLSICQLISHPPWSCALSLHTCSLSAISTPACHRAATSRQEPRISSHSPPDRCATHCLSICHFYRSSEISLDASLACLGVRSPCLRDCLPTSLASSTKLPACSHPRDKINHWSLPSPQAKLQPATNSQSLPLSKWKTLCLF